MRETPKGCGLVAKQMLMFKSTHIFSIATHFEHSNCYERQKGVSEVQIDYEKENLNFEKENS